uniref:hypothetical protein n=1 Tax=Sutterella wadsworthensis TaxID=40545 RepID=UPI003AAE8410
STCRNIENLQLTKLPNKRAVLEVQPFYLSAYIMSVSYPINIFSSVFKKDSLITFRLTELKAILFLGISP